MRPREVAPAGKWTGSPVSGVAAPLPLILPDPRRRFAATATRLASLAPQNPAEPWLRFMEQLAWGQHEAAVSCVTHGAPDPARLAEAVEQRLAPLEACASALDPSWQDCLTRVLDYLRHRALTAETQAIVADLSRQHPGAWDELAEAFVNDNVQVHQLGATVYVTAALQVHFTTLASRLTADALRLLPQRGLCPVCGSTPVAGIVTASGRTPGSRYLHCSLCSSAWNHVRAVCINCGQAGKLSLQAIEGQPGPVKAETCGHCGTYSKVLYEREDTRLDPVADDLATLGLDMLAGEAGWSRHAPNPLLLVG